MKIRHIIGLVLTFFMLSINGQAFATLKENNTVVESKELKADSNSEVILDKVKLVKYSNGELSIHGSAKRKFGEPAQYYRITVDGKKGTYNTKLLPIPDKYKKFTTNNFQSNSLLTTSVTYTNSVTVIIDTEDIPQENLAETMNFLYWNGNSDGTVSLINYNWDFWANPLTNVYTTWYVDTQNSYHTGPYYNSNRTYVYHDVTGQYYNWDWMDDNIATYTKHWSRIIGYSNSYGYNWNARHWGETSSILQVDVFVNGQQIN